MPLTTDALTQDELDYLAYATLSEKVANRDEVIPLDRVDLPTYNYLMRKAKKQGDPVRGGFRFNVKGLRNQRLTWWDGMDVLPFEERYTGMALKFYVGKGHFGDMLPFDFVERTGVQVNYERGIRPGAFSGKGAVLERVVNVIKENADDIKYNIALETAKTMFKSNVDNPKAPAGIDALLPVTTPTGGTVGGLSRSNPLLQHRVSTGWTADTILSYFPAFIRNIQRKANGKKVDYVCVGDNVYDLLLAAFTNTGNAGGMTGSIAGKADYRMGQDKAFKLGEKLNIGLPQDCFTYQDILIVNDPLLRILAEEDPTAGWDQRGYCITSDYLFMIPVKDADTAITHPMPYNQRVQFASWHQEWGMASVLPNAQGVFTVSTTGFGLPV